MPQAKFTMFEQSGHFTFIEEPERHDEVVRISQVIAPVVRGPQGERLRRFEMTCGPRGECEREPVIGNTGRWTWCAACLTVYDDYGIPVNPIPEFAKVH
jgi:hypothetical protein